jgi:methyl-accepting chemotaxis protein
MASQITVSTEEQTNVIRDVAQQIEDINMQAAKTSSGSQQLAVLTQQQSDLAMQLNALASQFKLH